VTSFCRSSDPTIYQKAAFSTCNINSTVHARKELVHVAHTPLSTRTIALNYLEVHVWLKISASKLQSFCHRIISNASYRIKQDKADSWKQKVTTTVAKISFYLTCVIAQLIVMLTRTTFRSDWGFCTRIDTLTCDRTCLREWTGSSILTHAKVKNHMHNKIKSYPSEIWLPKSFPVGC